MTAYHDFIEKKSQLGGKHGFTPVWMPEFLFDFQSSLVDWSLWRGRAAIFADCGLGKTPIQLVWAENVVRHTGGRVLILTPLAVSYQTVAEAKKFGIDAARSDAGELNSNIVITNYERLRFFKPTDFVGVVADESSILKNYTGAIKSKVTEFIKKLPYRLLATATAAPNDHIELGTSSEALGELGYMDMLNRFFKNDKNNSAIGRMHGKATEWRFKGHAESHFWRWVNSWARAVRKPSDIGFDDDGFILPGKTEVQHTVKAESLPDGYLLDLPAVGLKEQREERRRTITERCSRVADLVSHDRSALIWCHLNDEGDLLEKMIPDAVQVTGSDKDEEKERRFMQFTQGDSRVLITKPKIGGLGLNFQHCAHMTIFPSHSFEQYYQSIRRCWRYGQKSEVVVDVVTTEGEESVIKNLKRKSDQADQMFKNMVLCMNDPKNIGKTNKLTQKEEMPSWL